jgi:hypothetical protein
MAGSVSAKASPGLKRFAWEKTFNFTGKTDTQFRTEYDDFANAVTNDPRENKR